MTKRTSDSASKRGAKPPKRQNGSQPSKRHKGTRQDALLVENPETASPETALLEAVLPEAVLSEAALPETVSPEAVSPEAVSPEAVSPEAVLSEAALPETALPETVLPETVLQNAPRPTTDNKPNEAIRFSYANMNVLAYQAKLLEMAQANMQFAFEFAQKLTTIRSAVELPGVVAELTSKRIAMFWKHSTEMAELSTKRGK
jgi:hypothetical protein